MSISKTVSGYFDLNDYDISENELKVQLDNAFEEYINLNKEMNKRGIRMDKLWLDDECYDNCELLEKTENPNLARRLYMQRIENKFMQDLLQ